MNSEIVQLLASEKLNGDNYVAWKSNINMILVVDDLRFVLTEECPQTLSSNANQTSREAYDRWEKANEKAYVYILASMTDVLHFNIAEVNGGAIDEVNQTLTMGKGKQVEANVATTKRKFSRGSSSITKAGPSKPKPQIKKKGKEKTPKQNKGKKAAKKGKCYHCGQNGHWLRNCPKYLVEKKVEKKTQGNSSWKRLSEGEISLMVGTGEMVSAEAAGDLKLIGRLVKSGLLSKLEDNSLPPCESCLEGKMTKRSFTGKGLRAKMPLELIHSDLCGSMNVKAWGGSRWRIFGLTIPRLFDRTWNPVTTLCAQYASAERCI
ncbi:gag/pol protein [Cucumis melo var. makuwa]|uniref:Gag/pol protein n=1 Tax=Cucumis melo var. makuwa TaxID=1194695 RepID=A0A5A7TF90_CUCMM|nr:gag/pol protein [Cucumis melo var. makuwa]TYK18045.1 gag/pol protein [Cucumis melo var. makuwa]